VTPGCLNEIVFTHSECVSGATKNSVTCSLDGSDYKASGLVGSGAGNNPPDCSTPGDIVANETVNFQGNGTDVDVTINVYSESANGNPQPVSGHYTYCYRITAVRNGSVKKFTIIDPAGPSNVNYTSITGAKDPVSYGITNGDVYWDFRPTNNISVGETSAALHYTASSNIPVGTRPAEILDSVVSGNVKASVPEFTIVGLILSISIILSILFYKKMKQQKKGQLTDAIVFFVLLAVIIGAIGFIVWKDRKYSVSSYAVKEILPNGEIAEKQVSINTPSIAMAVETENGSNSGIVPLESYKKFRID